MDVIPHNRTLSQQPLLIHIDPVAVGEVDVVFDRGVGIGFVVGEYGKEGFVLLLNEVARIVEMAEVVCGIPQLDNQYGVPVEYGKYEEAV